MSEAGQHLCHEVVYFAYPRNLIKVQKYCSVKKKKDSKRVISVPSSSADFKHTRDRAVNIPLYSSREAKTNNYKHKVLTHEKKTSYTRLTNTAVNTLSTGVLRSEHKYVTSIRNKDPSRDIKTREKFGTNRSSAKPLISISKEVCIYTDLKSFYHDKATTVCANSINQGTDPCPNTQDSEIQVKVAHRNKSTVIMTQQNVKRNRSMVLLQVKTLSNMKNMGARRWALGYSDHRRGADF